MRDAFRALGHDAWSCDLLPSSNPSPYHLQCDVLSILNGGWDLAIFHPPCDYWTVRGNRWFSDTAKAKPGILTGQARREARDNALLFVKALWTAPIDRIALENPVGRLSTFWQQPTQYIHPWQFGHGETKKTGLWLKGLPPLLPTNIVAGREQRIFNMPPSKDRKRLRSVTYAGIAKAMAEQWGGYTA